MTLILEDFCGFQYPDAMRQIESTAIGSACSIVTSPAPFIPIENSVLKLAQHATGSFHRSIVRPLSEGTAWPFHFYVQFQRTGWPNTNNIPMYTLATSSGFSHIQLNVVPNGASTDIEVKSSGLAATVFTQANVFRTPGRWYRVNGVVLLDNTGGELILIVHDTTDGLRVGYIPPGTLTGKDFYAGTGEIRVAFNGEGGPFTPAVDTDTFYSSQFLFSGANTTLTEDDFVSNTFGDLAVIGAQSTKDSATPDVDFNGDAVTDGSHDLISSTKWIDTGDGELGALKRARYGTGANSNGAVEIAHPGSDPRVLLRSIRIGGSWCWMLRGEKGGLTMEVLYGKVDDSGSGYTVDTVILVPVSATFATPFKIVEDDSGDNIPALADDAVIGFRNALSGNRFMGEGWVFGVYVFPIIGQVSLGKIYTGRASPPRTVL